ncbi:hypothetical protein [Pseudoalteromonas ardens]|uniref:Lipoprotein n=1 Tax=Pseudoalteromonas rubra TaxID=43658 RepID=A0A0L0EPM6_9GAMM|nr:hypothetical protein [Pseudoalteromonas sp. R96]KNC66432.1 hypothetical protein AC626_17025 [Pseudoalteromonas rubra]MDK1313966.1 hypothetical protein [Pseudoalteromonas sp. R96]
MKKQGLFIGLCLVTLAGCQVSQPAPYEQDKAPEERQEYSGVEGLAQAQRDQVYLMDKELRDKCRNAKVDLAVAQGDKNDQEIARQTDIIKQTCRQ